MTLHFADMPTTAARGCQTSGAESPTRPSPPGFGARPSDRAVLAAQIRVIHITSLTSCGSQLDELDGRPGGAADTPAGAAVTDMPGRARPKRGRAPGCSPVMRPRGEDGVGCTTPRGGSPTESVASTGWGGSLNDETNHVTGNFGGRCRGIPPHDGVAGTLQKATAPHTRGTDRAGAHPGEFAARDEPMSAATRRTRTVGHTLTTIGTAASRRLQSGLPWPLRAGRPAPQPIRCPARRDRSAGAAHQNAGC
jgi:hypothetical protein